MKSSLKNMFLSLTIICICSAAVLALVNEFTKEPIALAKKQKLEKAIAEVVPEFDNSPSDDVYVFSFNQTDSALIYPAKKGDKLVGVAVETVTKNGFSGEIKILTGLSPQGLILNYEVLSHAETPGLGDKMKTWFKTDKKKQSVLGKDLSKANLRLVKDGGDVDAITASTITSRAFLEAVNKSFIAISGDVDVTTDASSAATVGEKNEDAALSTEEDGADAQSDATTQATTNNDEK